MNPYEHQTIEPKWQAAWAEAAVFRTPELQAGDKKAYILDFFPYPSGTGLHVGHLLGYTGSDIVARLARKEGKKVLHPMGWDAFGLPAENFAIKSGVHPAISTAQNVAEYKRQFRQSGISYDWSKEINASEPEYYRWTQWLFSLLYERGLAYRKNGLVNWCPGCQTVLANEQVVGGRCERSGDLVVQRELKQWYFRITDYAERLLDDLNTLDWPEKIKAMQRNWIGKSSGAQLFFPVANADARIEIFTTRPDTVFGATFLVLAPEHPLLTQLITTEQAEVVRLYQEAASKKSELERSALAKEKSGVFTGAYALNPASGKEVPIWIADYVLVSYGTGAIMAVPAHDQRDFDFAQAYNLQVEGVIEPVTGEEQEGEEFRRSIVAIVHDPVTNRYLTLNWGANQGGQLFIGGGVDDAEDPAQAALREIAEETGLGSLELSGTTQNIHHYYVAHSKGGVKRQILATGYLYTLKDGQAEQAALTPEEVGKFQLEWLDASAVEARIEDPLHRLVYDILVAGNVYSGTGILVNSGQFSGRSAQEAIPEILAAIGGTSKVTYRIRDWLVSRQRFWGAPIPIAYDKQEQEHLLPDDQLPVRLPDDVEFRPTGQSPLTYVEGWRDYQDPATGETWQREVDTLDTFVCSSWYYLRFPSPHLSTAPFDRELLKQWLPVDLYVGGAEHAVLHLLYARFITKVLFDAGYLDFDEPFQSLRNPGMILGPDHNKMSKSKGNTISPDDVVKELGADTLRVYEMFMAPFELEKPWSVQGITGSRRFLEKVWKLQVKVQEGAASHEELVSINQAITRVSTSLQDFRFNTAVSSLMETVNRLHELPSITIETYQTLLNLLNPIAPHITEELWQQFGGEGFVSLAPWPVADPQYLQVQTVEYPVQINGKIRAKLELSAELSAAEVLEAAKAHPRVVEYLAGQTIKKEIVIEGRLVSLVLV